MLLDWSSPRVWGCFFMQMPAKIRDQVFPTRVGVFLTAQAPVMILTGLPHACGGVSDKRYRA